MEVWLPVVVLFLAVFKVVDWIWSIGTYIIKISNTELLKYVCSDSFLSKEEIVKSIMYRIDYSSVTDEHGTIECPACKCFIGKIGDKEHMKCICCGVLMARYKNNLYVERDRLLADDI